MHTNLVQIGNSRGVRLPKAIIEAAGLEDELDLEVVDGAVIIRSTRDIRAGWKEAPIACHQAHEDDLSDWDSAVNDGVWQ